MNVEKYIEIRNAIPLEKVSCGYRTMTLFPAAELADAQVGYSISKSGEDFTGENVGEWKSSWLVIACEDLLGDPFFVDLNVQELPVFTAAHGETIWNPVLVASSFRDFIQILEIVERISQGRRNPVELERKPLSDVERRHVLNEIAEQNGSVSLEYWESWFEI